MKTLRIRNIKHLGCQLRTTPGELRSICGTIDRRYYRHSVLHNGKWRHFTTPRGRLLSILQRLRLILEQLDLPVCAHGGRKGRSIETNAREHCGRPALLKTDISDFFPSIASGRVYDLFVKELECSPDVGRHITRLVTLNGCLPQGSPTSPIVAALVSRALGHRLEGLVVERKGRLSQYVDDFSVSGAEKTVRGLRAPVCRIIEQERFSTNPTKTVLLSGDSERVVTGVRVNSGPDIPSGFVRKVRRDIQRVEQMTREGCELDESMVRRLVGQLQHMQRFNAGAAKHYRKRLRKITAGARRVEEDASRKDTGACT